MSERIRLGNVYNHEEYGEVLTVHKDFENNVWFRAVVSRDNAGVISTDDEVMTAPYKEFLGSVTMRDYPEDWDRKAAAVKLRDDHTCQGCGDKDADQLRAESEGVDTREDESGDSTELHAHHIVPLGAGGSNARSNLITLCDECHGRVHGGVT